MSRLRTGALAALAVFCLSGADSQETAENPPYDSYRFNSLSFNALSLGAASSVQALMADGVNRVWVGTNAGLTAVSGIERASQFPLTRFSDDLLSDDIRSIAFAKVPTDENFFLGFLSVPGIQYGRLLSQTGVSYGLESPLQRNVSGDPSGTDVNSINGLSSAGKGFLWAATNGGLVRWDLAKDPPVTATDDLLPNREGNPVPLVATDPWPISGTGAPATAYVVRRGTTEDALYATESNTPIDTYPLASARALAFDGGHNLWVAVRASDSGPTTLYKYPPPYDDASRLEYSFGGMSSPPAILTLAVDPYSPDLETADPGDVRPTVWAGTLLGGAWFQQLDGSGGLSGSWTQARSVSSGQTARVYVDPSGNVWLGENGALGGVRSLLNRLLTLSSTRFVGYGATAQVTVFDRERGTPDAVDTLDVTVNGSLVVTCTETGPATKEFRGSFGFAPDDQPGKVTVSGSSDTDIEVEYVVTNRPTLTASASWANIVPFEDDAWIGGPCFLRSLGR